MLTISEVCYLAHILALWCCNHI